MLIFDYEEDRRFFERLLTNEDQTSLDEFADLFDFSHPEQKRKAFNKQRDRVFERLLMIHSDTCQLELPDVCTSQAQAVDHVIPLSTNILNKRRGVLPMPGKKVIPVFVSISSIVLMCKV